MNIVLTGSLGNIGKPLTKQLVQKGHSVTVVSSKAERKNDIEGLGAKAAIGSILDFDFILNAFKGADIVYLMEVFEAVGSFFDTGINLAEGINKIVSNYRKAVEQSGIRRVVQLSSIGAHASHGNGILFVHHTAEAILWQLPEEVSIKFVRPVGFYTNLYRSIPNIKAKGAIIQNFGGDFKEPWVSPLDIADVIVEEMENPFLGRTVRYVASDEITSDEIAKILGEAIGMPELKWLVISDEEQLNGMLKVGINPEIARGFVEMQAAQRSGALYEDYYRNKPPLGKIKLADFAREFARVINQQ